MIKKQEEMLKNKVGVTAAGGSIVEEANEDEEETDGDIGEDERKARKEASKAKEEGKKLGNNSDLIRETGGGLGLMTSSSATGGYGGYLGGNYDYGLKGSGLSGATHASKI